MSVFIDCPAMSTITEIDKIISALPEAEYELFTRFYALELYTGTLKIPAGLKNWVRTRFGSVERVERQRIVSIKNRFTGEHSLFNELRSERPKESKRVEVEDKSEGCRFCNPEEQTPEDIFGRIRGSHCITASNITKYDSYHSLVIFREHNPLAIDPEWIADYLRTGEQWFEAVCKHNPRSRLQKFFLWNCLWRSGASIIHGHMQLTASGMRYGKLELLERVATAYKHEYQTDYLSDLCKVHESLGLATHLNHNRDRVLFYLTPVKEKEIVVVSTASRSDELADTIYRLLRYYRDAGVQSYNLAIFHLGVHHVVRLVDRGALDDMTSDIGTMELYAASVISSDPFILAQGFNSEQSR